MKSSLSVSLAFCFLCQGVGLTCAPNLCWAVLTALNLANLSSGKCLQDSVCRIICALELEELDKAKDLVVQDMPQFLFRSFCVRGTSWYVLGAIGLVTSALGPHCWRTLIGPFCNGGQKHALQHLYRIFAQQYPSVEA